jgi:hypothetical protein
MASFDLTQFNNINNMLYFKLHNPPEFDYNSNEGLFYTIWRLDKYEQKSSQPHLYGPDEVVITYVYWHHENEHKFNQIVVLGYEYDKDIRESWFDAASYHKYDSDFSDDDDDY